MKSHAEASEEMIWQVRRAFRELSLAADRELAALGIRARDRAFLEFLAREKEPISLSALARKHHVSRQHIQQTLRRLTRPGWVEGSFDPSDNRAVLLSLSHRGWEMWKKIRNTDRAFFRRLGKRLSKDSMVVTTGLLSQLRQELRALSKEDL